MGKLVIKPYDVVEHEVLPEMSVEKMPDAGDPLEIGEDLYFVCDLDQVPESGKRSVGVIPLIVKNPAGVSDIQKYVECLSIAHRKVQYRNDKGPSDLEHSNEMIIS